MIVRASEARRFGSSTIGWSKSSSTRESGRAPTRLSVWAAAPDATLYPSTASLSIFISRSDAGFEVSGGFRRLGVRLATNIYVGTVSKYVGNWMFTGKVFHVPGEGGSIRRRITADSAATSAATASAIVGATYSHGFSREEIRNAADLTTLNADTIRFEAINWWRDGSACSAVAGTSRQERQSGIPLWQTSLSGGFVVLF